MFATMPLRQIPHKHAHMQEEVQFFCPLIVVVKPVAISRCEGGWNTSNLKFATKVRQRESDARAAPIDWGYKARIITNYF